MSRVISLCSVRFGSLKLHMELMEYPGGPDDAILRGILDGKFDENTSLAWWMFLVSSAPPGSTFLDVGAFTGIYSLIAATIRLDARVVAFEPSSITWGRLARNILINQLDLRILPANVAAWESEKWISLNHAYGIYSMCPGEAINTLRPPDHSQTVLAVPLDTVLREQARQPDYLDSRQYGLFPVQLVRAVKIDVEGAEPAVLRGAQELIARDRPSFICEVLTDAARAELEAFFASKDYSVTPIAGERNALCLPNESVDELNERFGAWNRQQGRLAMRGTIHLAYGLRSPRRPAIVSPKSLVRRLRSRRKDRSRLP